MVPHTNIWIPDQPKMTHKTGAANSNSEQQIQITNIMMPG